MGNQVQLQAADDHTVGAYEHVPEGATRSLVVVQEIFGVNPHIQSVVDRFGEMGFHTIAPALFDRVEPGIELEYTEDGVARGRELKSELEWSGVMADVSAAVDHVAKTGPVVVVGYCYGGTVAWRSASELPIIGAVSYYGGGIHELRGLKPKVPVVLHFGSEDASIPIEHIDEVADSNEDRTVFIFTYPEAGHGFSCDARSSYHPEAAAEALVRTTDFFDFVLDPDSYEAQQEAEEAAFEAERVKLAEAEMAAKEAEEEAAKARGDVPTFVASASFDEEDSADPAAG